MELRIRNKRRMNKLRFNYPTMNECTPNYKVIQNYKGITIKDRRPKRFSVK